MPMIIITLKAVSCLFVFDAKNAAVAKNNEKLQKAKNWVRKSSKV